MEQIKEQAEEKGKKIQEVMLYISPVTMLGAYNLLVIVI